MPAECLEEPAEHVLMCHRRWRHNFNDPIRHLHQAPDAFRQRQVRLIVPLARQAVRDVHEGERTDVFLHFRKRGRRSAHMGRSDVSHTDGVPAAPPLCPE